jgi:hypothetical protein
MGEELTDISLKELVESDKIIYLTPYKEEAEFHKQRMGEEGGDLKFYVDKETNIAVPLQMRLYTNRDFILVSNQPIMELRYTQSGFMASLLKFNSLDVELPFGYSVRNQKRAPGNGKEYFPDFDSGWNGCEKATPLEAKIEFIFNPNTPFSINTVSVVKYRLQ